MKEYNFNTLVGKKVSFLGVSDTVFYLKKRGTNDVIVFDAIEDENDGYRSLLKDIIQIPTVNYTGNGKTLAVLEIEEIDTTSFKGYKLIDKNKYCWLKIGTDNCDDYYPQYIFEYTPKSK